MANLTLPQPKNRLPIINTVDIDKELDQFDSKSQELVEKIEKELLQSLETQTKETSEKKTEDGSFESESETRSPSVSPTFIAPELLNQGFVGLSSRNVQYKGSAPLGSRSRCKIPSSMASSTLGVPQEKGAGQSINWGNRGRRPSVTNNPLIPNKSVVNNAMRRQGQRRQSVIKALASLGRDPYSTSSGPDDGMLVDSVMYGSDGTMDPPIPIDFSALCESVADLIEIPHHPALFRSTFSSELSFKICQDVFWLCHCQIFFDEETSKAQDFLLDRISVNYVSLFLQLETQSKRDLTLPFIPHAVCHCVYLSLCSVFTASKEEFEGKTFRSEIWECISGVFVSLNPEMESASFSWAVDPKLAKTLFPRSPEITQIDPSLRIREQQRLAKQRERAAQLAALPIINPAPTTKTQLPSITVNENSSPRASKKTLHRVESLHELDHIEPDPSFTTVQMTFQRNQPSRTVIKDKTKLDIEDMKRCKTANVSALAKKPETRNQGKFFGPATPTQNSIKGWFEQHEPLYGHANEKIRNSLIQGVPVTSAHYGTETLTRDITQLTMPPYLGPSEKEMEAVRKRKELADTMKRKQKQEQYAISELKLAGAAKMKMLKYSGKCPRLYDVAKAIINANRMAHAILDDSIPERSGEWRKNRYYESENKPEEEKKNEENEEDDEEEFKRTNSTEEMKLENWRKDLFDPEKDVFLKVNSEEFMQADLSRQSLKMTRPKKFNPYAMSPLVAKLVSPESVQLKQLRKDMSDMRTSDRMMLPVVDGPSNSQNTSANKRRIETYDGTAVGGRRQKITRSVVLKKELSSWPNEAAKKREAHQKAIQIQYERQKEIEVTKVRGIRDQYEEDSKRYQERFNKFKGRESEYAMQLMQKMEQDRRVLVKKKQVGSRK